MTDAEESLRMLERSLGDLVRWMDGGYEPLDDLAKLLHDVRASFLVYLYEKEVS